MIRKDQFNILFLTYTNLHVVLAMNNIVSTGLLFTASQLFTIIDIIWIILDKEKSKVPKYELIIHHIASIVLLSGGSDDELKLNVLLIEMSTMFLILRRNTCGAIQNVMHNMCVCTWIPTRIVWLYYLFITTKYKATKEEVLAYGIIYTLGLEWTLRSLKLVNNKSYTSLLLGLALYINFSDMSQRMRIALWNLMTGSYVHHLIKNRISLGVDNINITFACLTYLRAPCSPSIIISILAGIQVMVPNGLLEGVICKFIYVYTMFYYSYYDMVKGLGVGILCGYIIFCRYNSTIIWHLLNGVYLNFILQQEFIIT